MQQDDGGAPGRHRVDGGRLLRPDRRQQAQRPVLGPGGPGRTAVGGERDQPQAADPQDDPPVGDGVQVDQGLGGAVLDEVQHQFGVVRHLAGPGDPADGGGHPGAPRFGQRAGGLQGGVQPADPAGGCVAGRRRHPADRPVARASQVADGGVGGADLDAVAAQDRGQVDRDGVGQRPAVGHQAVGAVRVGGGPGVDVPVVGEGEHRAAVAVVGGPLQPHPVLERDRAQEPYAAQGDRPATGQRVDQQGAGGDRAAAHRVLGQRVPGGQLGHLRSPRRRRGGGVLRVRPPLPAQPVLLPVERVGHQRDPPGRRAVGPQRGPVRGGAGQPGQQGPAGRFVQQVQRGGVRCGGRRRVGFPGGECAGGRGQRGDVADDEQGPFGQRPAAALQRPGDLPQVGRLPGDTVGQVTGQPGQRPGGGGGQRDGERPGGRSRGGTAERRCLLQDGVGVAPAEAERADGGATGRGAGRARPVDRAVGDGERGAGEVDVRVQLAEVRGAGDDAVAQHLHGLDQPGQARCAFQMPDVGLGGAHPQPSPGAGRGAGRALRVALQDLADGVQFDRVAERGAGAVGLQEAQVTGAQPGTVQRGADQGALGARVGCGEGGGAAAVVDRGGAQHGEDGIAVRDGPAEPLEHHPAGALAADEPVGRTVEHQAGAVRGEHAGPLEGPVVEAVAQQVGGARQGDLAVPGADRGLGERQRGQGAGAGGVDGDARPGEVVGVRDAVGEEGREGAHGGVAVRRAVLHQLLAVVVAAGGGEHADRGAGQVVGVEGGVLQRLPAQFEQGALLRVHGGGLTRGHGEERGVEQVDPVQQTGPQPLGYGPGEPVGGHRSDPAAVVGQQGPEAVHVVGARDLAGHPDHGDVVVGRPRPGLPGPGLLGLLDLLLRGQVQVRRGRGQPAGQGPQGRVPPDGGGGQRGAERPAGVPDQAQCLGRVEALLAEWAIGVHRLAGHLGGQLDQPLQGAARSLVAARAAAVRGGLPVVVGSPGPGQLVPYGLQVPGGLLPVEHGVVEGQDQASDRLRPAVGRRAEEECGGGGRDDHRDGEGRAAVAEVGEHQRHPAVGLGLAVQRPFDGVGVPLAEPGAVQPVGPPHHPDRQVAVVGGAGDAQVDVVEDPQAVVGEAAGAQCGETCRGPGRQPCEDLEGGGEPGAVGPGVGAQRVRQDPLGDLGGDHGGHHVPGARPQRPVELPLAGADRHVGVVGGGHRLRGSRDRSGGDRDGGGRFAGAAVRDEPFQVGRQQAAAPGGDGGQDRLVQAEPAGVRPGPRRDADGAGWDGAGQSGGGRALGRSGLGGRAVRRGGLGPALGGDRFDLGDGSADRQPGTLLDQPGPQPAGHRRLDLDGGLVVLHLVQQLVLGHQVAGLLQQAQDQDLDDPLPQARDGQRGGRGLLLAHASTDRTAATTSSAAGSTALSRSGWKGMWTSGRATSRGGARRE